MVSVAAVWWTIFSKVHIFSIIPSTQLTTESDNWATCGRKVEWQSNAGSKPDCGDSSRSVIFSLTCVAPATKYEIVMLRRSSLWRDNHTKTDQRPSMQPIEIYTTRYCPYCASAKALLKRKGLPFIEIDIAANWERRDDMITEGNGS